MKAEELLASVGLTANGPIAWKTKCPEQRAGVYVITTEAEGIVYIGRTSQTLARRLDQFYRHRPGAKSPHHGGEKILALAGPLSVYWSPTGTPHAKERQLIQEFVKRYGRFPHGNLKAGDSDKPVISFGAAISQ
jgi:hypothetical protein